MARATFRGPAARLAAALVVGMVGAGTAACSEDQSACEAAESLQQAIDNVSQVELSDEAIGGLNGALLDLGRSLEDAQEAGASEELVDDVTREVEELQRALGPAAEGETEASVSLAAVAPSVVAVLEGAEDVLDELDC
jgi:hypothetical protein